jgi:signal transduction protein with GAF and PtsI domain
LNKSIHDIKKHNTDKENKMNQALNEKGMEIARLNGIIQELENKIKHLSSRNQVEIENVEKTMLETRTVMNTEKERLMETTKKEKDLQHGENLRVRDEQDRQIDDLKKENSLLLDNYEKSKVR